MGTYSRKAEAMPAHVVTPSQQPPAVGYYRLEEHDAAESATLLKVIATACLRENVRLVKTFTDRGYDGSQFARPGIMELRDALLDAAGLVVIVPSLDHLSPIEALRTPLQTMISTLGGRLVIADEANVRATDAGSCQPENTRPSNGT